MAINQGIRRLVLLRDNEQCVHCGTTVGLSIQHRINRGMGGSKTRDSYGHLITMCLEANQRLESDADFAQTGMDYGWKLRSWEDPFNRAVWYEPEGDWFYLTERGTRIRAGETADG